MNLDREVAVVGAGPAGSMAAMRLAELGHDVVLVDRHEHPRRRIICTGIVGREAYEHLRLPREAVVDTLRAARFHSPSGVTVSYEPSRPLAFVVDRTRLDGLLARRAEDAGATLLRGWTALGVAKDPDGLTVTLLNGNGEPRPLRARALVVATGYQWRLHRPAGLGVPPAHITGVSADLPFRDLDAAELYFGNGVAPGFFAWAVPFGQGMARLGVLAPRGGRALFRTFLASRAIRSRLQVDPGEAGREMIRARTLSRAIVQGPVSPSYGDRVLAVGEAAGQVKTTTAGGIYYGMIGAGIAAEVLSAGLRENQLGAEYLREYERAWTGRLGGEIEAGLELQAIARTMSDPEIDRLFAALNDGLGPAVQHLVQFDWHRPALRALLRRRDVWRLGARAMSAAVGAR